MGVFDTANTMAGPAERKQSRRKRTKEWKGGQKKLAWASSGFRDTAGKFGINTAMKDWMLKSRRQKSPRTDRIRNLRGGTGWRATLTQAGGITPAKSSQDTTKEMYSTMETRFAKPNSTSPKSGFGVLGAETSGLTDNVSQMYKDKYETGAVRRAKRRLL